MAANHSKTAALHKGNPSGMAIAPLLGYIRLPMATTSPLPTNWTLVLEQIQRTLTQASERAQAREAALAETPTMVPSAVPPDNLAKHLEELAKRVEKFEAPLLAFDQVLQSEEEDARGHLAQVADLRQRLADWAGRAIG
jgi:hypothetical protein